MVYQIWGMPYPFDPAKDKPRFYGERTEWDGKKGAVRLRDEVDSKLYNQRRPEFVFIANHDPEAPNQIFGLTRGFVMVAPENLFGEDRNRPGTPITFE